MVRRCAFGSKVWSGGVHLDLRCAGGVHLDLRCGQEVCIWI